MDSASLPFASAGLSSVHCVGAGDHIINGIITVLNTPFTEENAIDIDGLRANVAYALDAGVAGFLVNGLAAEVDFLSQAERETILRTVVKDSGETPVVAGLGGGLDLNVRHIAERYIEFGAAGLLVNGADVSEESLMRVLQELDALRPGFLMLQDWDASGSGISVQRLLEYVDRIPSLRWLKIEVTNAGPKYSEIINRGPAHLGVAGGWAVREMMDGLERGVHAFMPTALHHTYCRILSLFAEGRRDESQALFDRLKPILDFSNQRLDLSIAFFKRLLKVQEIYATSNCRIPSAKIDINSEPRSRDLVELAMALEAENLAT